MRKFALLLVTVFLLIFMLTSCRPPELEGAFVDYNAGRIDNALKLAKEATEKYPDNAEAWYLLGKIQGEKDNIKEMIEAFDKSIAIVSTYSNDIKKSRMYYFQVLHNKGASNYNAFTKIEDRNSDEAKKSLNLAIKNFNNAIVIENDYKANSLVARCYFLLKDTTNAYEYYVKLTKINPDTADAWLSLGNFQFTTGDYNKAVENLNKALEIEPDNVEAISLLSQGYDLLNDRQNAIKLYKKAKEMAPEEKAFPFNLGLLYIKMSSEEGLDENLKKEYLTNSVTNFAEVINLDTGMKEPFELKSTAEIQLGRYEDAEATLKNALEYYPEEGSLWFNLGVAYSHLANKQEAEKAFNKAEELGYK